MSCEKKNKVIISCEISNRIMQKRVKKKKASFHKFSTIQNRKTFKFKNQRNDIVFKLACM